jgi:peptidyl-tRNA hydrolase
MLRRMLKGASTLAFFGLAALTFRWLTGSVDWSLAAGAAILSGFWLLLTAAQTGQFLRTYFDIFSRLQVLLPLSLGLILSTVALVAFDSVPLKLVAAVEFCGWSAIYHLYRRNRENFIRQGHGPLPKDCLVNPPIELIEPLDLILTSGRIASRLDETVGHGELAIRLEDGRLGALSSYMEKGVVINDLERLIAAWLRKGEHYIVLKLKQPASAEQIEQATKHARQMLAENIDWRDRTNGRRARIINLLPLPTSWRERLVKRTRATGYDWIGLLVGTLASQRWTCIGSCLEAYRRLGIKTRRYGTGMLGLGTGLLDPIMPVRFLDDPQFNLVSVDAKPAGIKNELITPA